MLQKSLIVLHDSDVKKNILELCNFHAALISLCNQKKAGEPHTLMFPISFTVANNCIETAVINNMLRLLNFINNVF